MQLLRSTGCLVELGDPKDAPDELARKLSRFSPDALIVRQGRITGAVLDAPLNLRVICKHGVGTDNIDVEEATRRRIPVMFTPGTTTQSAAEHTLGLILSLTRRIPYEDRRMRAAVFGKTTYAGQDLFGMTLGLVGFGSIARRLAALVAPFDVKVVAYHPSCTVEALPDHVSKVKHFEDLLPEADILSLHCPLSPATRGLVNKRTIELMKDGAYIVNTARGGLIDESQLFEALSSGRVRGAALDVFEREPPAAGNPLMGLENVILTPHVGGASDRSLAITGLQSVRNVLAVLENEPIDPLHVVNAKVLGLDSAEPPASGSPS